MAVELVQRKPTRRVRFVSGRVALSVAFLGLAAGIITGGYRFLTPATASSRMVVAGTATSFPPQTVTYVPGGHFYLVHFDGDQFIALFERSPWSQSVYGAKPDGCRIRWYLTPPDVAAPTLADGDSIGAAVTAGYVATGNNNPVDHGFFMENCGGWLFDAHGRRLFGASASLSRFPLRITDGNIAVDTGTLDNTWWRYPLRY